MKFQLYSISDQYIRYLTTFDHKVLSNHEATRQHKRPYIGHLLIIGEIPYFLPLSSPDGKDYLPDGTIRPSTLTIQRILNAKGEFIGKILLNNMVPVPIQETCPIYIKEIRQKEKDEKYARLVTSEKEWIEKHQKRISTKAKILYKLKNESEKLTANQRNGLPGFLKSTVSFSYLEKAYKNWIKKY